MIGGAFIADVRYKARERNIEFNLTMKELLALAEKQRYKCALTGWDINVESSKKKTASLDRINPKMGYTIDNVQWTHKDINLMKLTHSQERFIELCKAVANNQK
ncbi:MAG: hypothetical protein ACRDBG_15085 [Waterburya sp.]